MSKWTALATAARGVGEHVVALSCVGAAHKSHEVLVEHFGPAPGGMPLWGYMLLAVGIYVAGWASARFAFNRMARSIAPPLPAPETAIETSIPVVSNVTESAPGPSTKSVFSPPHLNDKQMMTLTLLGSAVMVAAALVVGRGPRAP
jgi:hypothetical protein